MAISYNGLWKILIDNGMKKGDLKRRTGISSGTIAKMTNGEAFHTFQSDTLSLPGGTGLDNTDRPLLKYN